MKKSEMRKKRKENMLLYLKKYKDMYNISPTIREICIACDIPSTASASDILEECKREGYIVAVTAFQSDRSAPRSLTITEEGNQYILKIEQQTTNNSEVNMKE